VPAEASGVTYSPVTNSLYVITRNPQAVVEYNLEGRRLREVPYKGLSDPEGAPIILMIVSISNDLIST
jgi:uncharacterized protein YjiK